MKSYQKLDVDPYTQWEPEVASPSSACGPATMAALAEYWRTRQGQAFIHKSSHFHSKAEHINYIYRHHGGAPWGMSVKGFKKGIKAYIGAAFHTEVGRRHTLSLRTFNDFVQYKDEIEAGRPVAIKFDKWFNLRWKGSYVYDYHWVIGIGYEEAADSGKATLIILDNGVKTAAGFIPSRERRVDYGINKDILTMVALNIEKV
ncbi:C39 family peptidase [Paenibacillus wynnii]|uniref:C39 family peptidase n=1 Tax=Paenibacillus wynnii TaxID=268407 RepID=UPI000689C9FB|nr:C39 family peptidase [Paenibacillus wynnii]